MELRHLRYFVAVAREENVTRAAAALRVAQPSLSRQIRDLEEELGFGLFEREARSIRLSAAGRHFLDECEALLTQVSEAVERTRSIAEGRAGVLRVGFAPSLTVQLIPRLLRAYAEAMPGVRVELHDLSTREMMAQLDEGSLDAALLVPPGKGWLPQGWAFHELLRFGAAVAVPLDHPLAWSGPVAPEKVAAETLMVYARSEYPEYHDWIAPILTHAPKQPGMEEHHSAATLMAAVESGRGVAIVQSGLPHYVGERLCVIPIHPAPPPLVVGVAYRHAGVSLACRKLIEIARACA